MDKIFIIVNKLASKFEKWEEVLFSLKRMGLNFQFNTTSSVDEARDVIRWAKDNNFENIFIAGGDGSCNLLINCVVGSNVVCGFIPLGTGNLFCRELGFYNIDIVCKSLMRRKVEHLDISCVNDSFYFGCIMGIGADGERVHKFLPKRREGTPITYQEYFLEAISGVVNPKEFDYRIECADGRVYEGRSYQIFVGNVASFFIPDKASLHGIKRAKDKLLDIVVLKSALHISGNSFAVSPKTLLKALVLAISKKETRYYALTLRSDGEYYTANEVMIFLSPPQYYHIDGELVEEKVEKIKVVNIPESIFVKTA